MFQRFRTIIGLSGGLALVAAVAVPAHAIGTNSYTATAIVTDATGATTVDPALVNPWGMSQSPTSPVWVANNGTSTSTLYANGAAPKVPLTVTIPGGAPTGTVFNGGTGFPITTSGVTAPARFIFASETGMLTGWNGGTSAVVAKSVEGAVYKGLTIATRNGFPHLYATNFVKGRVDVFGQTWKLETPMGAFQDNDLPDGYAPFGIQAIGEMIYVSYALRDGTEDVAGPGLGYVDVFTTSGVLVKRLIKGGELNAPWGMAMAPEGWGAFGGDLLVGNFGNGTIHAYDAWTGEFKGTLKHNGAPIVLDGLWGLLFGNGKSAATNALMFTAGTDDEAHGLWGVITADS
ncbi:MAG: hypothetical protein QOC60_696 [Frankiaceae bacterium]|jgi:uncharacterized protein (TIGR03118 family)|nr:hypothetical protein [Frankiaceae bacterium]